MRERDLAQPRKAKIFFRQGRLLCNARVKETRSTQLNAPNFVIKELSVMLVANKQEQQCQEKSGEKGVRGEQGGPKRAGGSREDENMHDKKLCVPASFDCSSTPKQSKAVKRRCLTFAGRNRWRAN